MMFSFLAFLSFLCNFFRIVLMSEGLMFVVRLVIDATGWIEGWMDGWRKVGDGGMD